MGHKRKEVIGTLRALAKYYYDVKIKEYQVVRHVESMGENMTTYGKWTTWKFYTLIKWILKK
jgi:hypothetical protein